MRLFEIQRELKYEFNFELVPIQSGYYFNLFNEDADFFRINFNFKTYEQGTNKLAGFPITRLQHYKEKFDKMNISYAFVEQEPTKKDNSITRIVTFTSNINAIDKTFNKKFVQKKEDKLKEYLSALINGFNPFNGIYFKEDSVWKHPEITSILNKICEQDSNTKKRLEEISDKLLDNNQSVNSKYSETEESKFTFFLIKQIENFLPKLNDRDIKVMKYLYNDSNRKITLTETGKKFNLTKERIRQIKNKTLMKLSFALQNQKFIREIPSKELKMKKNALNYVRDVFQQIILESNHVASSETKENYKLEQSNSKKYLNPVTIKTPSDLKKINFFKIELLKTFTPRNKSISRDFYSDALILERRKTNIKRGFLVNAGFPITFEEIETIKLLFQKGHNIKNLEAYFQRSFKSIIGVLRDEGFSIDYYQSSLK